MHPTPKVISRKFGMERFQRRDFFSIMERFQRRDFLVFWNVKN